MNHLHLPDPDYPFQLVSDYCEVSGHKFVMYADRWHCTGVCLCHHTQACRFLCPDQRTVQVVCHIWCTPRNQHLWWTTIYIPWSSGISDHLGHLPQAVICLLPTIQWQSSVLYNNPCWKTPLWYQWECCPYFSDISRDVLLDWLHTPSGSKTMKHIYCEEAVVLLGPGVGTGFYFL